ncbi:MAG: hypothetical protein HFJ49_03270 [Clostridia bacterium]|jgi:hypothetical protein|nr:hypothetical protein [Clostridia bacterium]
MTLGENKKITLGLIEEYSKINTALTEDEDIATRLNFAYATNYQELSQAKKIIETQKIKDISGNTSEGYTIYKLPTNLYQIKRIIALDENNNIKETDYYTLGKEIYISNKSDYIYILEYYKYPTVITEKTADEFDLEIEQDAQMILPYAVANDILKVDPSADYTAFLNEYRRKKEELDTRKEIPSITVVEGVL